MLVETDEWVCSWARDALTSKKIEAEISTAAPSTTDSAHVFAYLLKLAAAPGKRSASMKIVELELSYLVTVSDPDPAHGHLVLDSLILAANDSDHCIVEYPELTGELWSALGVKPGPCFLLKILGRTETAKPEAPAISEQAFEMSTMVPLRGRVINGRHGPMPNVQVSISGSRKWARTNARGEFRLLRAGNSKRPLIVVFGPEDRPRKLEVPLDSSASNQKMVEVNLAQFSSKEG